MSAALVAMFGALALAGWALARPAGSRSRPIRIRQTGSFRRSWLRGARRSEPARFGSGEPGPVWSTTSCRRPPVGPVALVAIVGLAMTARGLQAGIVVAATAGLALAASRWRRRRDEARLRAERAEAAPAVIDLLGACMLAGLNPHLALRRVAERSPQALRPELGRVVGDIGLGRTPGAALRAAAERSGLDELRAAAGALEAAERWGMPPAEALAARAEALRSRSRLRAEAEAGRAAVRLAFPLVFCFLPAFVLLTVVPTVAGAVRALAP